MPHKTAGSASWRRLLAGVAVLAAGGAMSGAALAASSYSVKASAFPTNVSQSTFKAKVTGTAPSSSQVTAFVGGINKACAASAKLEAAQPARRVINKTVSGNYTATKTARPGSVGTHRLCAYLTSTNGSTTRAHSSIKYNVLAGAY